jgi:nitrile hydratase subunit beta
MNGVHDMGGMHGFGPVTPEPDEPVFHADWERRVFALTVAMGATGEWSLDASRFARESEPPASYVAKTYYELWLAGLERLLLEHGLVSGAELAAGRSQAPGKALARTVGARDVAGGRDPRPGSRREAPHPARFAIGDRVRARNMSPPTHTRLPRYVRGHVGSVVGVRGCHVFPDSNAHDHGEDPRWLYTVAFDGAELWGEDAERPTAVSVDAFEPYLEPVG